MPDNQPPAHRNRALLAAVFMPAAQADGNRSQTLGHKVKPDEYGDLLERYNKSAAAMGISDPPPLIIIDNPKVGGGAHGTPEAVSITEGTLNKLTSEERDYVLAHELGHVAQKRSGAKFNDWKESEKDADRRALRVTRNPDAAISALSKLASATIEEFPAVYHKANPNSPLTPEILDRVTKDTQEMLNWRSENIKAISPSSDRAIAMTGGPVVKVVQILPPSSNHQMAISP